MVNTDPARAAERQPQPMTVLAGASDPAIQPFQADDVWWLEEAGKDLETVVTDPAVRDLLKCTAKEVLHNIVAGGRSRCVDLGDAGTAGAVMWHRGIPDEHEWPEHEWQTEEADGPESYFLFYRLRTEGPGFEVLSVRSVSQFVQGWKLGRGQLNRWIHHPKRRRPWSLWR